MASISETSTCWPSPRASRCFRAARAAKAACRPSQLVGDVNRGLHRRIVTHCVQPHQARHGLGLGIVSGSLAVRSELSVSADRDVDDVGIDGADVLVAAAPIGHSPGSKILHDDIGLARQFEKHVATLGTRQIEGHVALVAIHRGVEEGNRRIGMLQERRQPVGDVGRVEQLDLDDVGAVVGQHAPATGTGPSRRDLQHANAVERSVQIVARLAKEGVGRRQQDWSSPWGPSGGIGRFRARHRPNRITGICASQRSYLQPAAA